MTDLFDHDRKIVHLQTPDGRVGAAERQGLLRARGIPYGRARRFAPAEAVAVGDALIDAVDPGPAPPQQPSRLEIVMGSTTTGLRQDENCLVVSVTAPTGRTAMPVMVWLHGGAYVTGSGESAKYDPTHLAAEGGVVVVNVSHRLGLLGYLTPPTASEHELNLGLADQVLALRWVQRNIAAFGGDPANVTLFGQSAGADSIWALLVGGAGTGLFGRAILQSAPLGLRTNRAPMRRAMLDVVDRYPELVASRPTPVLDADGVLAVQAAVMRVAQTFGRAGALPFAPTEGGDLLPDDGKLVDRIRGVAPFVDLMLTHTANDARPFVLADPRISKHAANRVARATLIKQLDRMTTARVFASPAAQFAKAWRDAGGNALHYRFDWSAPDSRWGACHCIDLPFLFPHADAWLDAPMLGGSEVGARADHPVGTHLRASWAAFARDGQPPANIPEFRRLDH
jgi:para-nitrobenzyl esterase